MTELYVLPILTKVNIFVKKKKKFQRTELINYTLKFP